MSLLSIEEAARNVHLGLWEMTESLEYIFKKYPFLLKEKEDIYKKYKSDGRRLEVLTVRLLLREMLGNDAKLFHDSNGCPHLSNGKNISISHTKGYLTIIISPCNRVSIDIEFISERVNHIASRFLRYDEKAETLIQKLIHWCAKETLYKLYTEDKLSFNDMKVLSINGNETAGIVVTRNLLRNENLNITYRISDNFVLTYTIYEEQHPEQYSY